MKKIDKLSKQGRAVAVRMTEPCDAGGFPAASSWERAVPLRFRADWRGENGDPERGTEGRVLWTPETLFLGFRGRNRTITGFPDSGRKGRRDQPPELDGAQ